MQSKAKALEVKGFLEIKGHMLPLFAFTSFGHAGEFMLA